MDPNQPAFTVSLSYEAFRLLVGVASLVTTLGGLYWLGGLAHVVAGGSMVGGVGMLLHVLRTDGRRLPPPGG